MAKCSVCQHENEAGSEYCEECGVKLEATATIPESAEAPKAPLEEVTEGNLRIPLKVEGVPSAATCPSCGFPSDPGSQFCSQCGTRLKGAGGATTMIKLKMVSGRHKDRIYQVDKNEILIGRMPENDIPLETDAYVSGRHTRIVKEGEEFFVEDLGSTNGTFIKVKKLTKLAPGDEVKVGQSIFKLED